MKVRKIQIRNGDIFVDYRIYECCRCKEDVEEAWPHYADKGEIYCHQCAFIVGIITEAQYLKHCGIYLPEMRAKVHNGKIHLAAYNQKFAFEKSEQDYRNTNEYKNWRASVFERDGYTCQVCGIVGGSLNAHHIKSYKDHIDLRTALKNGITLCEKCHRDLHKRLRGL